jgi:hypothetical protein
MPKDTPRGADDNSPPALTREFGGGMMGSSLPLCAQTLGDAVASL